MSAVFRGRSFRGRGPRPTSRSILPAAMALLAVTGLAVGPGRDAVARATADRADVGGARAQHVTFHTTLTAPSVPGRLDLLIELDLTGSYQGTLPNVRRLLPDLRDRLARTSNLRMGVVSFADDPCCGGDPGDVPYTLELPLTANGVGLEHALAGLRGASGGDTPESWLEATNRGLTEAGFKDGAQHVLVLATDTNSHHRGDGSHSKAPTVSEVAKRLVAKNVRVVVLVPKGSTSHDADRLAELTGGTVKTVSTSSEDLDTAILAGLEGMAVDIEPTIAEACPVHDVELRPSRLDGVTGGTQVPIQAKFTIDAGAPIGRTVCQLQVARGLSVPFTLEVKK